MLCRRTVIERYYSSDDKDIVLVAFGNNFIYVISVPYISYLSRGLIAAVERNTVLYIDNDCVELGVVAELYRAVECRAGTDINSVYLIMCVCLYAVFGKLIKRTPVIVG